MVRTTDEESEYDSMAQEYLYWDVPYETVCLKNHFFVGGKLNACYNAVDRHYKTNPDDVAFISIDENDLIKHISYDNLYDDVMKMSSFLKSNSLFPGDVVSVYGSNSYEVYCFILACTRLGIVINLIFGGYSSEILTDRVISSKSKMIVTMYNVLRKGKEINYYKNVLESVRNSSLNVNILVFGNVNERKCENDFDVFYWEDYKSKACGYIDYVRQDSNDKMFIIFTSGSTGKGKGIIHNTGGWLFSTVMTIKKNLHFNKTDVFFSTADVCWLAGLSHSLFGPLLVGGTSIIFEGSPFHPSDQRVFEIISRFKCTHLYTAPTVLRILQTCPLPNKNLSSLKLVGVVGEILTTSSLNYLNTVFKDVPVINTYWQTETGAIMLCSPLNDTLNNSVGFPVFGIKPFIVRDMEGLDECDVDEKGFLLFRYSWPSVFNSILSSSGLDGLDSYSRFNNYYFTGDLAKRDKEGRYYILGRCDDVINVAAHRISTYEVENIIYKCEYVKELAVFGISDDLYGSKLLVCVVPKINCKVLNIESNIRDLIRKKMGGILLPYVKVMFFVDLPKTNTGKIKRNLLKKLFKESPL